jgi:hypothetical protein
MLLLAFLTYYGQYSGNFVMTVDEEAYDRGIAISETPDFETYARWLTADAVEEVREITLEQIVYNDLEGILTTDGSFRNSVLVGVNNSKLNYLAYSFYLRNVGKYEANIGYEIVITEVTGVLATAIRVLIIQDGYILPGQESITTLDNLHDGTYKLYQLADTKSKEYPKALQNATPFVSESTICSEEIHQLGAMQTKKFTILMWLEGEDPDCTIENVDQIYGSKIKIAMNFALI